MLISCAHHHRVDERKLDRVIQDYHRITPGLVISFGTLQTGNLFRRAYGDSFLRPFRVKATVDTIYDIASITKLFTATAIAILVDEKKLNYETKISDIIPEFGNTSSKCKITVEDVLRHKSGLPEYFGKDDVYDPSSLVKTWKNIFSISLLYEPHEKFLYSNSGYMILAKVVEIKSGISFDEFVKNRIFIPLKMTHSFFAEKRKDCAPTTPDGLKPCIADDIWVQRLGGVAGHDSIFSTVEDLEKFALMWLGGDQKIIQKETLERILKYKINEVQGLGPDFLSEYSDSPRGDYFSKGLSFGHTGFTGTSIWMDPTRSTYLIILSNRLHLGHGNIRPLRRDISNVVAQIIDEIMN